MSNKSDKGKYNFIMDDSSSKTYLQNFCKKPKICTDVLCLFLFGIFWILLIVIAVISIIYGNYLAIINGYDTFGNICGIKHNKRYENFFLSGADTSKKPYVLFFSTWNMEKNYSVRICVEHCVDDDWYGEEDIFEEWNLTKVQYCRYDFPITQLYDGSRYKYTHRQGPCPTLAVQMSYPVKRRCIPSFEHEFHRAKRMYSALDTGSGFAQLFCMHIYLAWYYIVALSLFALVVSITLVVILQRLSKIIPWIICVLVIMTNSGLCAVLWDSCNKNDYAEDTINKDGKIFYNLFEDNILNKKTVCILAKVSSVITALLIIVTVLFARTFYKTAVIFEEAADCLTKLTELLKIPAIALIGLAAFLFVWSYVVLCMTTATNTQIYQFLNSTSNGSTWIWRSIYNDNFRSFEGVEFADAKSIQGLLWMCIVGFIWTTEFIFACEQFSLDAAVAHWYFKRSISSPTKHAIGILFKYHLGTVAMGSFFITLFRIPRLILTYLFAILKAAESRGYFCFKDCKNRFEWIGSLHHNAYAVVAMKTMDFCPAGRIAWKKMTTDAEQVWAINKTTNFVLFLAKLFVASLTCLVGFLSLKADKQLMFYMAPVLLSTVFAFYIAHVVISLFEMIIDTLFVCVCEDRNINGRGGRWVESNLAALFSNKQEGVQRGPIQVINIRTINRQP